MFGAVVSPAVVQYEAYILEKRLLFCYVMDSRGMERVSPIILASVLGIAARVEVTVSTAMMSLTSGPNGQQWCIRRSASPKTMSRGYC